MTTIQAGNSPRKGIMENNHKLGGLLSRRENIFVEIQINGSTPRRGNTLFQSKHPRSSHSLAFALGEIAIALPEVSSLRDFD